MEHRDYQIANLKSNINASPTRQPYLSLYSLLTGHCWFTQPCQRQLSRLKSDELECLLVHLVLGNFAFALKKLVETWHNVRRSARRAALFNSSASSAPTSTIRAAFSVLQCKRLIGIRWVHADSKGATTCSFVFSRIWTRRIEQIRDYQICIGERSHRTYCTQL